MNRNPKSKFEKGHTKIADSGRKPGQQSLVTRMVNEAAVQAAAELGEVKVVPVKNRNGKVIGSKFDWDGKDELVGFFRFAALTETAVSHANRGSFDNGVVHQGRDEGDVLAGQAIDKPAVIEAARKPKFITHQ
jgi:hypothetical protein